jgi:hypothetical protein
MGLGGQCEDRFSNPHRRKLRGHFDLSPVNQQFGEATHHFEVARMTCGNTDGFVELASRSTHVTSHELNEFTGSLQISR